MSKTFLHLFSVNSGLLMAWSSLWKADPEAVACVPAFIHGEGLQRTEVGTGGNEGEGGGTI